METATNKRLIIMLYRIEITPRGFEKDAMSSIECVMDVQQSKGKYYIPETFRSLNEAKNWMRIRASILASDAEELQLLRSDIHYCNRLCFDNFCLEIRNMTLQN